MQTHPSTANNGAAVPGANSFTRIAGAQPVDQHGYSNVSTLKKGNDGIWRGTAMKNGSSVQVSVDYKGDIARN